MMTLETKDLLILNQMEKDRKALYEKLMQERYGIPTRGESIQENSQAKV